MGKGIDFMEGSHEWHGIAPNDEQLQKALAQLPETLGDYLNINTLCNSAECKFPLQGGLGV